MFLYLIHILYRTIHKHCDCNLRSNNVAYYVVRGKEMGAQGILEKTLEGDESSRVVVADRSFNKIQFKLVFDIRKKVAVASFIFNRA